MKRCAFILLLLAAAASAQLPDISGPLDMPGQAGGGDNFSAEAVPSHSKVAPGDVFHVAVILDIAEGWAYYSPAPGGEDFRPRPAEISATSDAFEVVEILWPPDKQYLTDLGGTTATNYAYKNRAVAYIRLRATENAEAGEHEIKIAVKGQICKELCIDVDASSAVKVAVADKAAPAVAWTDELQAGLAEAMPAEKLPPARQQAAGRRPSVVGGYDLGQIGAMGGLGLAILAGLILNVTPCVLPVIPIRILTVVDLAGKSRRRFVTLGLAFAIGIVLFFAAIAVVNVALHLTTQQAFDWGRHFQNKFFRAGLALLLVAMAANLFGVFTVFVPQGVAAMGGQQQKRKRDHLTATGMGLMLAIMSTPCSFAILMVALAWAQLQPLWLGTTSILLLGVGMAFPHALLAAFPSLVDRIPKPGRWTELLKEGIGFIILVVAVWLLGTLGEDSYPAWVTAYAIVLVFALWMWGRWVRFDTPRLRKWIIRGVAVALAVGAGYWMLTPSGETAVKFENYSAARVDEARQNGRPVLVKFTAAWCGSCKWVEWKIYDDPEVAEKLNEHDVLALEADVTDEGDPGGELIYDELDQAPPLTLVYPPREGPPIALLGKFSKKELFSALKAVETKQAQSNND